MTDMYLKASRIDELFSIYNDLSETAQVIAREVARMYTLDGNMGTLYTHEFDDEVCEHVQPYEVVEAMEDFNHQFGYRLRYRLTSDSAEDWRFQFFMNQAEREAIYPDGE